VAVVARAPIDALTGTAVEDDFIHARERPQPIVVIAKGA
jgi:hypothetical protein